MKKENTDLTRRSFLSKGAAVAAGASIIAIPALAANTEAAENSAQMLGSDPVYTDDVQTLTNKTIASNANILGTDSVNIKEFFSSGTDITTALNSAISALSSTGGRILIPRGVWYTDGGHTVTHAISIEGVGINSGVAGMGSVVRLNTGESSFVFKLVTPTRNVSFKNFAINLNDTPSATGILMTDIGGPGGSAAFIYSTRIENLGIYGGAYGIKVESSSTTQFECILNTFERIHFVGCYTCFYNNTVNSGYKFDNCHFYLPTSVGETPGGTALNCVYVGNISLEHCLFVGTYEREDPFDAPDDGTTILKTVGLFNSINFYDCQDENVQYAYQNSTNPWVVVALVYRNCLIQSNFKFTAHGKVVLDSCRCAGTIYDSANVDVKVYLKGAWNFFSYNISTGEQITYRAPEDHVDFSYAYSQIVYENLEANAPLIKGSGDIETGGYYIANGTRGSVVVLSGTSYVQVYNNVCTADSLIFLQLRTYDSGGARIREVQAGSGYFVIYLTQNAASNLSVAFLIEG